MAVAAFDIVLLRRDAMMIAGDADAVLFGEALLAGPEEAALAFASA